jgi:2-oxoglutarate ferredoxin oxidoreductase subunit gamma
VNKQVQVRLGGSGGQGLITAGVILAEAGMLDGLNVVQTQTYGPEARLGSSKAEVIISSDMIAYPEVTVPDVLLCMSAEAAKKYTPKVRADTIVVLDSTNIGADLTCKGRVFRLPITQVATQLGTKVVANAVALGVINALVSLVSKEALARALTDRVPARFRELNERALVEGERLAATATAPAPA